MNAVEIDEMHHLIANKKKKFWIFKVLDRDSGKIIPWTASFSRGVAAVRPLIKKFEQMKDCVFFTDHWPGFRHALAKHRHVVGKDQTVRIERDNSNTRDRLARMKRRTKVVSKKPEMVDISLRLWQAFEDPDMRSKHVETYLSLYN